MHDTCQIQIHNAKYQLDSKHHFRRDINFSVIFSIFMLWVSPIVSDAWFFFLTKEKNNLLCTLHWRWHYSNNLIPEMVRHAHIYYFNPRFQFWGYFLSLANGAQRLVYCNIIFSNWSWVFFFLLLFTLN